MSQNFAPSQVCVDCNGKCCQHYAGILIPDDTMDLTYFIRPAHTNAIGKLKDASWCGVCVFFKDSFGCTLDYDKRPAQCRTLEPGKEPENCKQHLPKQEAVKLWIPYQDEIVFSVRCLEEATGE